MGLCHPLCVGGTLYSDPVRCNHSSAAVDDTGIAEDHYHSQQKEGRHRDGGYSLEESLGGYTPAHRSLWTEEEGVWVRKAWLGSAVSY